MKRSSIRPFAALLAVSALATGCVDDELSLTITRAVPLVEGTDTCVFSPTTDVSSGGGTLDIALADTYVLGLVVRNNLPDTETVLGLDGEDARIDTHPVLLRKVTIKYLTSDQLSVSFPGSITQRFSSFVEPSAEGQPSEVAVGVEVFTTNLVEDLRNAEEFLSVTPSGQIRPQRSEVTVIVGIQAEGEMLDGTQLESNVFEFPIRICQGCLVRYPASAGPDCTDLTGIENISLVPCQILGQDNSVDCRLCREIAPNPIAAQLCEPPS